MAERSNFELYLPYFQDRYTFEICPAERVNEVISFIDTYWKKDHVFVRSPELLKWLHYDKENDRYNFVIASHKQTKEIHALLGFIFSSHFDSSIEKPVLWGSMWKNRSDIPEPGLGLMVEWKKDQIAYACATLGLGMSKMAVTFTKRLKGVTGVADQYYILHPEKTHFQIASNTESAVRYAANASDSDKKLIDCPVEEYRLLEGPVLQTIPCYKSQKYYENRYFNHPVYQYRAVKICDSAMHILGVIFWRMCYHEGAKCIRIVDYFGEKNALSGCRKAFLDLLFEQDAEYIDFLCVGMPAAEMESAGFLNRKNEPPLVLPNYFEPFVAENVDITYVYRIVDPNYQPLIFKGDADQDRPN